MKTLLFTLTLCLLFSPIQAEEIVKLKGSIAGKYKIEMELEKSQNSKYGIQGKYRYEGKSTYLDLQGDLYDTYIVQLTESSKGKVTGEFFLELDDQGKWSGKWVGTDKHFDVTLEVVSGDIKQFKGHDFKEISKKCTNDLTGSYAHNYYFLNDMWLDEGNMEVGFNGGIVTVEEIDKKTLSIEFEFVCGPTYHIAYFKGKATRTKAGAYEFNAPLYEDEDACHLIFRFDNKSVNITQQSSSMACEFGARAYADGDFTKINDKIVKGEGISIEKALNLK